MALHSASSENTTDRLETRQTNTLFHEAFTPEMLPEKTIKNVTRPIFDRQLSKTFAWLNQLVRSLTALEAPKALDDIDALVLEDRVLYSATPMPVDAGDGNEGGGDGGNANPNELPDELKALFESLVEGESLLPETESLLPKENGAASKRDGNARPSADERNADWMFSRRDASAGGLDLDEGRGFSFGQSRTDQGGSKWQSSDSMDWDLDLTSQSTSKKERGAQEESSLDDASNSRSLDERFRTRHDHRAADVGTRFGDREHLHGASQVGVEDDILEGIRSELEGINEAFPGLPTLDRGLPHDGDSGTVQARHWAPPLMIEPFPESMISSLDPDSFTNLLDGSNLSDLPEPPEIPGYATYSPEEVLGGWEVDGGYVDLVSEALLESPQGQRSIDLGADSEGSGLVREVETVPGQSYQLTFAMSGNWLNGETTNEVDLSANKAAERFSVVAPSSGSLLDSDWETQTFQFVADSEHTLLQIAAPENGARGAIVSDLHLMAVPVPLEQALSVASDLKFDPWRGEFFRQDAPAPVAQSGSAVDGSDWNLQEQWLDSVEEYLRDQSSTVDPSVETLLLDGESFVGGFISAPPGTGLMTTLTVHYYWSPNRGDASIREAANYLGSSTVTTDASGNASFSESFTSIVPAGSYVSATATSSANSTSELSPSHLFNTAPTEINASALTISENSSNGSIVGSVSAVDPDAGDSLTYSFVADAGGRFDIAASTGLITVANGSLLDFETATSHTIVVRATDSAGMFVDATFSVGLTNINEAPHSLTLTGATTAAGVSAIYNATLDSYYAIVTATRTWEAAMDHAQASFVGGVSGTLVNINSAEENAHILTFGTPGWIGASDKQQEGVWRWYDGDTAGSQFWDGTSAGTQVGGQYRNWNSGEPNNLGNEDYAQVLASGGRWNDLGASAWLGSFIEWSGAAVRAAAGTVSSVMENATAGMVIGTLSATDPDGNETLSYSLIGDAANKFTLVGNQLRVASGASFNYESTPVEVLTVRVTDAGGLSHDQIVSVRVVNVNEAPTTSGIIQGSNLITNGSFEVSTADWTMSGTTPTRGSVAGATAGAQSLIFGGAFGANDGVATTTIATVAGQAYTLTFEMGAYATSASGVAVAQAMNVQVLGDVVIANETVADAGNTVNSFNTYRVSFVADSTMTTLRFADASSTSSHVDFALDNIQMFAIATDNPTQAIAENSTNGTVVGQFAAVDPDANSSFTYSLTNNARNRFAIDSATGQITVANGSAINFESSQSHTITVRTTDQGGLIHDKIVTVSVTNVNESPIAVADNVIAVEAGGIANGSSGLNPTGNALSNDSDIDAGDTRIVIGVSPGMTASGNSNVDTNVVGAHGSIRIAADGTYTYYVDNSNAAVQALRTESDTLSDVFSYTIRDAGGLTSTTQITVTIQGANDSPIDITSGPLSIAENSSNGSMIGTVSGIDLDAGDTLTYSLVNDASGRFAIQGSTGQITVANGTALNFESASNHTIVVRATDLAGQFFDKSFVVNVTNVNEAPTMAAIASGLNPATITITVDNYYTLFVNGVQIGSDTNWMNIEQYSSNLQVGDVIAVSATDIGGIASLIANIRFSNGAEVNSDSSWLVSTTAPVGWQNQSFDDSSWSQATQINTSAASPWFLSSRAHYSSVANAQWIWASDPNAIDQVYFRYRVSNDFSVSENAANGTFVGNAVARDVDAGSVLNYSLIDNAGGRFAINNATGRITVANGNLLDFESSLQHNLIVRATDQGGLFAERSYLVNLRNVNEAPIALSDTAIAVEAGGAANGTAGTNPTGNVLANDTDVDAGDTRTVNGVAPGIVESASTNVGSNVTGTYGSIAIAADGSYTYMVNNDNNVVQALRAPSDTLTDVFTYTMRDAGGLISTTQLTVTIQGANDAPIDIASGTLTVAENSANGSSIGTVLGVDVDAGDTLTYSLVDNAGGRFTISGTTGQITVANGSLLDFESAASHTIVVRATDLAGLYVDRSFNVGLTDVNEAPIAVSDTAIAKEAGGAIGDSRGINPTGNVLANDTDVDAIAGVETLTVTGVVSGIAPNANGSVGATVSGRYGAIQIQSDGSFLYTVDNDNAAVRALKSPTDSLVDVFTYTVADAEGATSTTQIQVSVLGDNSAPTDIIATDLLVDENARNGLRIGTFSTLDYDLGDTAAYSLVDDGDGRFSIDPTTGELLVADSSRLDFEKHGWHQVTVQATDAGGLTVQKSFIVTVRDVNEVPIGTNDRFVMTYIDRLVVGGLGVLENDMDPENRSISATLISGPQIGSLRFTSDGRFEYDTEGAFVGEITFVYRLDDGVMNSEWITVTIDVELPTTLPGNPSNLGIGNPINEPSLTVLTTQLDAFDGTGADWDSRGMITVKSDENSPAHSGTGHNPSRTLAANLGSEKPSAQLVASFLEPFLQGVFTSNSNDLNYHHSQFLYSQDIDADLRSGRWFDRGFEEEGLLGHTGVFEENATEFSSGVSTSTVVQTVVGTGMVLWLAQGFQIAATVVTAAPIWAAFDPAVLMLARQREGQKKEKLSAGEKIFEL